MRDVVMSWRMCIVLYVVIAAMHLVGLWFVADWRMVGVAVLLHGAAVAWFVFLEVRSERQGKRRDGPRSGSGGPGGR